MIKQGKRPVTAVMAQGDVHRSAMTVHEDAGRSQALWRQVPDDLNGRRTGRRGGGDVSDRSPAQGL
jgi:hypothetical protein